MCTAEAVPADDDASGFDRDPASGRTRTDTAAAFTVTAPVFRSTPEALRIAGAALDYLNAAAGNVVAGNTAAACDAAPVSLDGAACGEVLIALGEIQAKLTAAHAGFLRRFDAADAHDADGYGTSSSWLAAKAGLSKKAAKAAVRQMRQLRDRPLRRHRHGWTLTLHPDGTTQATSPDRRHTLHSHAPPGPRTP